MTTRRQFIQTTSAAVATGLVSPTFFPRNSGPEYRFIRTDTLENWPVADPVQWCLDNRHKPILTRAVERLEKLGPCDGERIIRLVIRRTPLNLLEIQPGQVVVHYWGAASKPDLRPFFKKRGLARVQVAVQLRGRKKEITTLLRGDDFLFGDRLAADFPLAEFQNKWLRRYESEPDDWTAVPGIPSVYSWSAVERDDMIPWAAFKFAWRRGNSIICQNCELPAMLIHFGACWVSMSRRLSLFVHACLKCRRSCRDDSPRNVDQWLMTHLDTTVRPDHGMVCDNMREWDPNIA